MSANTSLERRVAEHYASEPPLRAPDRVLHAALATIETTKQRRGLAALRRNFDMPSYLKLAAAAVVLIAVGAFAVWQFAPPGPGGPSTPSPSPTVAPSPTATPRPVPTYVPPPLTETFTSDLHGLTLSYPAGWTVQAATVPWTNPYAPQFGDPSGDLFYDPERDGGHLFLAIGSRSLGETPLAAFLSDFLAAEGCTRTDAIEIDGADEAIGTSCDVVLASSDGRGYVFMLYSSDDDIDLRSFDKAAWFEDILATVELHPEDAVDGEPTPS